MVAIIFEALAWFIPDILLEVLDWQAAKKAKANGKKRHIQPSIFVFGLFIIILAFGLTLRTRGSWPLIGIPQNQIDEMDDIVRSLNHYKNRFGNYPQNISSLIQGIPLRERWLEDYWGTGYQYVVDTSGKTFELRSYGKDKKLNTEDDLIRSSPQSQNTN